MLGMDSSPEELGSTEETLLALLDFLVDPLLPCRSSSKETISPSQEELIAKQVQAVVLLYNYYHRKQHPGLAFLEFQSFCKQAMALKPSLQLYFRHMQKTDSVELDDLDKDLSLTENAIMNACDTAMSLDASNNNLTIDGWPVSKVAVFLVDSRKENCYLFHSSITKGVWSAIEKEVDIPNGGSEAVTEASSANKKTRVVKRAPKENQTTDETSLQQLAYIAVKEACGINHGDLRILENHLVYSTSKAKTAVRLYIIQCRQTNQDVDLVPINDVIDSLQGPLVRKESVTPVVEYFHLLPFADIVSGWLMRAMSEDSSQHFEAEKLDEHCNSFLSSGEQLSDTSCHFEAVKKTENCASEPLLSISEKNCTTFHTREEPFMYISESFKATEVTNGNSCHVKEGSIPCTSKYSEESKARNVDSSEHFVKVKEAFEAAEEVRDCNNYRYPSQPSEAQAEFRNDEEPRPYTSLHPKAIKVKNNSSYGRKEDPAEPVVYKKRNRSQKNSSSSKISGINSSNGPTDNLSREAGVATASSNDKGVDESFRTCSLTGGAIVAAGFPDRSSNERDVKKALSDNKISDTVMPDQSAKQDCALVPFDSNFELLRKLQLIIASKDKLISQTALKVQLWKREQLSQQHRKIADEIALCDRNIQTILSGGQDDFAVKIDSIVEGCNEICQTAGAAGDNAALHFHDQDLLPVTKRKRLSEANLCLQSPCQVLDGICTKNLWMLPTYCLSVSEGGFQASVTMKGVDFESSSEGTICKTPSEARNSAASNILVKLQSMAAES